MSYQKMKSLVLGLNDSSLGDFGEYIYQTYAQSIADDLDFYNY